MNQFLQYLHDTGVAVAIRQSAWLFPSIETVHVLAIAVVIGSISMVDLRLLHVSFRGRSVRETMHEALPWTWSAFVLAVASGSLMFFSRAPDYWALWTIRTKAILLAAAGLNMLFFHFVTYRSVDRWNTALQTPLSAKLAGGISLLLWIGVVVCGRLTGFLL